MQKLTQEILPDVDLKLQIRSFAAVRPNPQHVIEKNGQYLPDGRSINSFVIEETALHSATVNGCKHLCPRYILTMTDDLTIIRCLRNQCGSCLILESGKGLTAVPTVEGSLLLGPTKRPCAEEYAAVERNELESLQKLTQKILPDVDLKLQIRSFAALRNQCGSCLIL